MKMMPVTPLPAAAHFARMLRIACRVLDEDSGQMVKELGQVRGLVTDAIQSLSTSFHALDADTGQQKQLVASLLSPGDDRATQRTIGGFIAEISGVIRELTEIVASGAAGALDGTVKIDALVLDLENVFAVIDGTPSRPAIILL